MTDRISKRQRSKNMSAIHSKNTIPEIYIRKLLFARGFRYRISNRLIIGTPDLFIKKYNLAVFVNGCFWHRHINCKYATIPKTNIKYWREKFASNINRDRRVRSELEKQGIRQLIIWECTLKKMKKNPEYRQKILTQIIDFILSDEKHGEF
ncbi:DNA mismatch endonuclease Vsr [Scardovia wiggsiae F0424]|uniref:Very short patch repair endonuclease n=1 Tax=Scardovia wiggsiae F0424 TaxID=857290 RepID=J0X113_9BIFI|nr:very short patch repair endonuclease [Scardovia wiggsiae]EJD65524.1 DNA mismatch endonuclease Vsr [Scardovia wiggsiae F0424]